MIQNLKFKIKNLQKNNGFVMYFTNTSWLFGEKILRMIVGLSVGIWVARYLGPEQFGLFSYAQSFVGLFIAFATLGLDGFVVRELVKDQIKRDIIIGTAFTLKLIGSFLVIFVLGITINFTSSDAYTRTLIFIIASATIFQSFNVVDFYFQSKIMSKYIVYANTISLLISSVLKVVFIYNKLPLLSFAWLVLFDSIIMAIGYIYFFLKTNSKFKIKYLKYSKTFAKALLKESWPLIISGIVVSVYMRIDQVMIKEMLDNNAVGQYAVSARINEIFLIPVVILSKSLAPAIFSRIGQKSELNLYKLMSQYYTLTGFFIIFIVLLGSDFFILNTFGTDYQLSASLLNILVFSTFLVYTTSSFSNYFIGHNKTKITLTITTISVILNILLNFYFIKYYGVIGAAYATVIARSTTNFSLFFINKDLFKIQIKSLLLLNFFTQNK
jgi:O-antigen/teichoic acid export membrane protein